MKGRAQSAQHVVGQEITLGSLSSGPEPSRYQQSHVTVSPQIIRPHVRLPQCPGACVTTTLPRSAAGQAPANKHRAPEQDKQVLAVSPTDDGTA